MSVFLQPIYTQTVGAGGAASVTFNNIPQGFTDLLVQLSTRSAAVLWNDDILLRFNADTGNNYSGTYLNGNGAVAGTGRNPYGRNNIFIGGNNGASSTSNTFASNSIYISNYASGDFKAVTMESVQEGVSTTGGQINLNLNVAQYLSTTPITSLTIYPQSGSNFVQNSTFTLYGITNIYDTGAPTAPTIGAVNDLAGIAQVTFTQNDSGTGRLADNYSVQDLTIMSAPVYGDGNPIPVPVTTGVTYNGLAVTANNAAGSNASANPAGFTTYNNYAAIASATITGSATQVLFTNIPQYYKHLQLRMTARGNSTNTSAATGIQFNADGNNNYAWGWHNLYSDGASATGSNGGGTNYPVIYMNIVPGSTFNAALYSAEVVDILDYSDNAKFKTVRSMGGYDANGSGFVDITSGLWQSLQPISSMVISWSGSGFLLAPGTRVHLYGIG